MGYDISPLAHLISRVKVHEYRRASIETFSKTLAEELQNLPAHDEKREGCADLLKKAFPGDLFPVLTGCAKTLNELRCSIPERDFFRLALLAVLPRFSRAKATGGWLKWVNAGLEAVDVPEVFHEQIQQMTADIPHQHPPRTDLFWRVAMSDARSIPDDDGTYTYLVTSPPYPNRHDYTRIFGVELLFGFMTWKEMRELRHGSLQSHPEARPGRIQPTGYSRPSTLAGLVSSLRQDGVDARLPRMLEGYFKDIYQCLQEANRVCRPGAKLAFVVGNVSYGGHSVPVDELTAELGQLAGLECTKIYVARYRGNSAQQMRRYGRRPSREAVVVFQRR